jgi:hypothetical protein
MRMGRVLETSVWFWDEGDGNLLGVDVDVDAKRAIIG